MKYNVNLHPHFKQEFKKLVKKYPLLTIDLENIIDNIEKELALAVDLGDGFKKIRINIKSKGKGASGGGRLITQETIIEVNNTNVTFTSIFNKADFDSINISILKEIIK